MNILILIKNNPMPCRSCVLLAPGEPDERHFASGPQGKFQLHPIHPPSCCGAVGARRAGRTLIGRRRACPAGIGHLQGGPDIYWVPVGWGGAVRVQCEPSGVSARLCTRGVGAWRPMSSCGVIGLGGARSPPCAPGLCDASYELSPEWMRDVINLAAFINSPV